MDVRVLSCPGAFANHPHPGDIPSLILAKMKSVTSAPFLPTYTYNPVLVTFRLSLLFFYFFSASSANFPQLDAQPMPQEQEKLSTCRSADNLTQHTSTNTVPMQVSSQKPLFAGSTLQRKPFLI